MKRDEILLDRIAVFSLSARAHTNTHTRTHARSGFNRSFVRSLDSTRLGEAKRSEVRRPTHPSITPSFRGRARIPDHYHYYHNKRRVMNRRSIASGVASAVGSTHSGSRARVVYCVFIFYTTLFIHIKNTTTTRARNTSSSTYI